MGMTIRRARDGANGPMRPIVLVVSLTPLALPPLASLHAEGREGWARRTVPETPARPVAGVVTVPPAPSDTGAAMSLPGSAETYATERARRWRDRSERGSR